jgi:hypothetical protein
LAKEQKIKNKQCWKIRRACFLNTPLTKNQRLKKYLKVVFEKHVLRTKNALFL